MRLKTFLSKFHFNIQKGLEHFKFPYCIIPHILQLVVLGMSKTGWDWFCVYTATEAVLELIRILCESTNVQPRLGTNWCSVVDAPRPVEWNVVHLRVVFSSEIPEEVIDNNRIHRRRYLTSRQFIVGSYHVSQFLHNQLQNKHDLLEVASSCQSEQRVATAAIQVGPLLHGQAAVVTIVSVDAMPVVPFLYEAMAFDSSLH